jgi:translation initiation factor 2 alpha subunit (eIF-2alpha)
MAYQEGDLVLCTVDKIEQTTVFVKLPTGEQGTIITSEIAPGRIKNIREYVVPNKKIVCKILKISGNNIELSLRRVSVKERTEIMDKYKQEQSSKSALNQILKENYKKIEEEILKDFPSLFDFLLKAKDTPEVLEKYIPKQFHEAINKLTQKKHKDVEVKKIIKLRCFKEDGIKRIKAVLTLSKDEPKEKKIILSYLAAGSVLATSTAPNYKEANTNLEALTKKVEQKSKQNACEFSLEEKKQ